MPGRGRPRRAAGYSPHSLRAAFVTWAHLRGAFDREIAAQTQHRSLASAGGYVRVENARASNAATNMGHLMTRARMAFTL
ncbi:hypothetical protein ACLFMI_11260 [Pseudonocardia nantongensis]|uniref:hypothetical protein n=1 Tax=Pseudonocardia nantongensis TaxID=1181885 RepID=UPI00397E13C9